MGAEERKQYKRAAVDPLVDLTADGDVEMEGYGNRSAPIKVTGQKKRRRQVVESLNEDSRRILV